MSYRWGSVLLWALFFLFYVFAMTYCMLEPLPEPRMPHAQIVRFDQGKNDR